MNNVIDFVKFKEERDQVELEALKEDLMEWMLDPTYQMENITFTYSVEDQDD